MNDNEFEGVKSPGEEPVQEFQQYIMNVEETTQRRPALRFAFLVGGVAVGSYFGVGRHVKALVKASVKSRQDVEIIRDYVAAIGELASADWQLRATHANVIQDALKNGDKFKHYPGVGVWLEGGK